MIIIPLLAYTSGWAIIETYVVSGMVGQLQTAANMASDSEEESDADADMTYTSSDNDGGALASSDDLTRSLSTVALFGGLLLLGNCLELQVEYLITTHTPLVKNAMKVAVTTRTPHRDGST